MNFATVSLHGQYRLQAVPFQPCYWHPEVLETFILQMSGQGLPVSASMMLGDRDYARQQLRHAYTLDDALLHELAVEMWSFFTGATPAVVQVVALTQ